MEDEFPPKNNQVTLINTYFLLNISGNQEESYNSFEAHTPFSIIGNFLYALPFKTTPWSMYLPPQHKKTQQPSFTITDALFYDIIL